MIITPDTLKALFIGFKKNFQDGLKMAESQYKEIATVIPSSTASNTYGWLGQWPAFREWDGRPRIPRYEGARLCHHQQAF